MPLIPALRRLRQADLCEFKVILVYKANFRTAKAIQRNHLTNEHKQALKSHTVSVS